MPNYFGFIDETGVLSKDPDQPCFGLGLVKLEHTAPLYHELSNVKHKAIAKLSNLKKPFEFKFSNINLSNFGFHRDFLELYFRYPEASFSCLIIDKTDPEFDMEKGFDNSWSAYIAYSKLLVKSCVKEGQKICVLSDFISKPKASPRYYEIEVGRDRSVYNACMLESHASIFVQLADVLIGCVVLDFRMKLNPSLKPNILKLELLNLVQRKLRVKTLARKLTRKAPNTFSVWPFRVK